jgi:DNA polymerase-3 subunit epsilon
VYRDFDTYVGRLPISAYNLPYDLDQVLSPDWERTGIKGIGTRGFCVLELTQRLLDPSPAGNCKLQTLRQFYRMPERGAHTALGDVMTVADLLENILRPMAVSKGMGTWDDLASFMSEPWYPRRIRMGKFKGTDFMDALANRDLRAWLEWLAQSTNERSANMGKWYLEQLEFCGNQPDESFIFVSTQTIQESTAGTGTNTSLVIYSNPDIDILQRAIAAVRERLAEVEAQYTRDRNAVNVIQAKLFSLLRAQYQKRDRLKNTVFYRRTFLDAILRGEEEDANVQIEASAQANEEVDSEYERASQSAESKKALTQSEEKELDQMYRKLVSLYDAAVQHFGSWREALSAAGINLTNVSHRRPRHLDREMMILWLRNRHAAGQSLIYTEVCLENRDHALAIRRAFDSWSKALKAAGLA